MGHNSGLSIFLVGLSLLLIASRRLWDLNSVDFCSQDSGRGHGLGNRMAGCICESGAYLQQRYPQTLCQVLLLARVVCPDPRKDPKSTTPNSGLQNSHGVDFRTLRWMYFLDPLRGLGDCRGFGVWVSSSLSQLAVEGSAKRFDVGPGGWQRTKFYLNQWSEGYLRLNAKLTTLMRLPFVIIL